MHQNVLVGKITAGNLKTGSMLQGMQGWFHRNGVDSYVASRRAWASLYGMVQRNASMLSFVEAFWVMGVLFLVMMPFVLLLRNPRRKPPLPGPPPPAEQITEVHEESQDEELLLVHG
jgi:DHA2 family multidrug resistance protein